MEPIFGAPNGIRTRVTAVKGRCPRPLDDRVSKDCRIYARKVVCHAKTFSPQQAGPEGRKVSAEKFIREIQFGSPPRAVALVQWLFTFVGALPEPTILGH